MKKYYFSHDSDARNDEKIINLRMRHKAAGYGVYFMILERMREMKDYKCPCDYKMISYDLRVSPSIVKSVVEDFGLFDFTEDKKFFYSKSFLTRMKEMDKVREKRAKAGKASAEKRMRRTGEASAPAKPQQEKAESEGWTKEQYARQLFQMFNGYVEKFNSRIKPVQILTTRRIELCYNFYSYFKSQDEIKKGFKNAVQSDYLNGRTKQRTKPADFDWIMQPENFMKCVEGNI